MSRNHGCVTRAATSSSGGGLFDERPTTRARVWAFVFLPEFNSAAFSVSAQGALQQDETWAARDGPTWPAAWDSSWITGRVENPAARPGPHAGLT